MKRLVINSESLQVRVALTEEGIIQDYFIERERDANRIVGSIYKGKIRNLEPSLQAAFVDIGFQKNAFLHYWDMVPQDAEELEAESDDSEEGDDEAGDDSSAAGPPQADDGDDAGDDDAGDDDAGDEDGDDGDGDDDYGDDGDDDEGRSADGDRRDHDDRRRGSRRRSRRPRRNRRDEEQAAPEPKPGPQETTAATESSLTSRLLNIFGWSRSDAARSGSAGTAADGNGIGDDDDGSDDRDNGDDRGRGGDQRGENRRGGRSRDRRWGGNRSNGRGGGQQQQQRKKRPPRRRVVTPEELEEIPKKFTVNSDVVVQVSKGQIGTKGPRVTTNLSIPGRYVVLLPNSDHCGVSKRIRDHRERSRLRKILRSIDLPPRMGCICRTASSGLDEETLRADIEMLVEKWVAGEKRLNSRRGPVCLYQEPDLVERTLRDLLSAGVDEIVVDDRRMYELTQTYINRLNRKDQTKVTLYDQPTPIFTHYHLDSQIQDCFKRRVALPSGAELCFDETEALIAIDVNSGKSRGGKDHPETILNTNLEACEEVARQLRLRNVGGLVVVDFIDMRSRKDQQEVYHRMKQALRRDRARTRVMPISRLGLLEMTRQREHESLQNSLFSKCPHCNGTGLVKSVTSVSVEIQRRLQEILRRHKNRVPLRVMVHPSVLRRLKREDARVLCAMEEEYGGELSFRASEECHNEEFHIINMENNREL